MIKPSKYSGINFSYDFTRSSKRYNFDRQRVKNLIPCDVELKYLSFSYDGATSPTIVKLFVTDKNGIREIGTNTIEGSASKWIIYFTIAKDLLTTGLDVFFSLKVQTETIFSEIYKAVKLDEIKNLDFCQVIASNADSRHGYLTKQTFAFFKFSKLKSDIFLNKKTEYEYSYSRKKILSSENQIGKKITFHDLTMYNANLLKWLCNCENLSIDGVNYQLISDFSELEADPNSEVISLQADFVEVNQSFFSEPSVKPPVNVFVNNFFN